MLYFDIMALGKINRNIGENFTGFFQWLQEKSKEIMRKAKTTVQEVLLEKHIDPESREREKEENSLQLYNSPLTANKDNLISLQLLKKTMGQSKQTSLPLNSILSENENFSITTKPDMEYSIITNKDSLHISDESKKADYSYAIYNIIVKRDNKTIREYKQAKIDIKQNQENDWVTLSIYKNEQEDEKSFILHPSYPFETSYITKIQQTT